MKTGPQAEQTSQKLWCIYMKILSIRKSMQMSSHLVSTRVMSTSVPGICRIESHTSRTIQLVILRSAALSNASRMSNTTYVS
ncbi:hypothetical protein M413DRAFT_124655 [Hebeloma cylindrosporum]|uniref:Uncharacterized protein n=1 Tax=Hebeloma cylindrosporum TaxID=76867 RepID=A0A0C2XYY0_HEBCY|nr:hypothetical protein M413DRAFT_124655 [Hebeloma cylindrosporum h7]